MLSPSASLRINSAKHLYHTPKRLFARRTLAHIVPMFFGRVT